MTTRPHYDPEDLMLGLATLGWKRHPCANEHGIIRLAHADKPRRYLFVASNSRFKVGPTWKEAETVSPAFRDYALARAKRVRFP